MTDRQIRKARRTLDTAGTPDDRESLRNRYAAELRNDIAILTEQQSGIRDDFHRRLSRWRTEVPPDDTPVHAIPSDLTDARLYRITGLVALLCEVFLASWVFGFLGVPWWIGALSALAVAVTLHGVFLHVFDNPERPKEAIRRLRVFVLLPAIIGFIVALALAVLARYVTGDLAVALLPVFSLSLWLGTISLLLIAAGLLTLAHLRGCSQRHEHMYRTLDRDRRRSADFLSELAHRSEYPALPAPLQRTNDRMPTIAASIILALALFPHAGCTKDASAHETSIAPHTQPAEFDVYIDWSGSCVRPALQEAWETLSAELPEIIMQHNITTATTYRFAEDGWSPERLQSFSLPAPPAPHALEQPATEWAAFGNFRQALAAQDAITHYTQEAAYRATIREALKDLNVTSPVPEEGTGSPNSDILGLLARIASVQDQFPRYVVIVTDAADTGHRQFPKLAAPPETTRALVLIAPARPEDARSVMPEAFSHRGQYENRRQALNAAAPWLKTSPYFARDIARLLN